MQLIQFNSADDIFRHQVWLVTDGDCQQFIGMSNEFVDDSEQAAHFFDLNAAVQVAVDATARERKVMN